MKDLAIQLLKERKLKITLQRISIISILLDDVSKAYSLSVILKEVQHEMNRSTVYRTLDKLVDSKLILKFIDTCGDNIFTINHHKKCENKIHPHLRCDCCGMLKCLPPFPQEYINELRKNGVFNVNMVLNGLCNNCPTN